MHAYRAESCCRQSMMNAKIVTVANLYMLIAPVTMVDKQSNGQKQNLNLT